MKAAWDDWRKGVAEAREKRNKQRENYAQFVAALQIKVSYGDHWRTRGQWRSGNQMGIRGEPLFMRLTTSLS